MFVERVYPKLREYCREKYGVEFQVISMDKPKYIMHLSIPSSIPVYFCLFVLRFNVTVNNRSVMSGRSHRFLGFIQYSRE